MNALARRARHGRTALRLALLSVCAWAVIGTTPLLAQPASAWTTAWAASVQGPYPVGNVSLPTRLERVFPSPESGARNQSFRLIVRPDVWGPQARIRLSNALGTKPVTFDDVFVGLQLSGSAVLPGTNTPVLFSGRASITIAPGTDAWSDAVTLRTAGAGTDGRKLAVSVHVAGDSGPMTWHAKALTTSYVSLPGSGSTTADERELAFPASTTSWFFLDALDMRMPQGTRTIVTLGDSITGATLTSAVGNGTPADSAARETKRQALNTFIRTSGVFDGVFDFDRATTDPATGAMRDAFIPNSTDGGPGDHLHPNRLGYAAMAGAVALDALMTP